MEKFLQLRLDYKLNHKNLNRMARGIGSQAKLSVCDTLAGVYEQKLERRPFIVPGSYDMLDAVKHDIFLRLISVIERKIICHLRLM